MNISVPQWLTMEAQLHAELDRRFDLRPRLTGCICQPAGEAHRPPCPWAMGK